MICDGDYDGSLHEKMQRVKEKCKDDPFLLSFFEDLERYMDEEQKRVHDATQKMIGDLFYSRVPRDSHLYINL